MGRSFEEMPTIQNVTPGGRATLNAPLGLSYDQIMLELTDLTPAELKNFKVITGSKAQWDVVDGQRISDLNSYYKRDDDTGYLTLWFYRPEMSTEEERALTSMGTSDIPSLTVQFDIDSGAAATAKVKAYAVRRAAQSMGAITKLKEYPATFATAGVQDIDNIPRGARIACFHLFKSDVSNVELKINDGNNAGNVVEWPKPLLEQVQKQYGRSPLSGKATHLDMDLLGKVNQFMSTQPLVDMRLKPTIDTSGGLTTLVEYIDGFEGI